MPLAPEVTTTEVALCTADDVTASRPQQPGVTARGFGKVSAKSAAHVAATAVMWLIVLAVITVV
jgi:hypothetical protein